MESRRVTEIRQGSKPKNLPPRAAFGKFMEGLVNLSRRTEVADGVTLVPTDFPDHTVYLAFRYLDLISGEGRVTGRLVRLLAQKIGAEDWQATLREVTTNSYAFVFRHLGGDISDAAPRRFVEAFDPVSPTKGSVEQCIEFFRKLCWAVGIPVRLSAHEQGRQEAAERLGRNYPAVLQDFVEGPPETRAPVAAPEPPVDEETDVEENSDFLKLQVAVAEVLPLIGSESNFDLCVETLRDALPERIPAPLPDLPPFDRSWDAATRARWFEIYALRAQHEFKPKMGGSGA